jgi:hypothetical protein
VLEQVVDLFLAFEEVPRGAAIGASHPDADHAIEAESIFVGPVVPDVERRRASEMVANPLQ